ncbi:hypothetical protein ES703_106508 [subsurface metagenome]
MNTEDEERRVLIARLVAILCMPLKNCLRIYEACDCRNDVLFPFLKARSENGAFRHVWLKVFSETGQLRKQNLVEDKLKARLVEVFITAWRDWANKDPEHEITEEDLYWLTEVTEHLGISDLVWMPLLKQTLGQEYDKYLANFNKIKQEGYVPETISAEEYGALLLTIRDFKFNRLPYEHPLWQSLGVKTYAEYRKQGLSRVFREAQWAKTGELNRVYKAFITAATRASKRQGTNTRTTIIERLESIEDTDKLSERVMTKLDLRGIISMAHLSPQEAVVVEGWRTGELSLSNIRRGYGRAKEFAELKGIPPKALYVLEARAMKKLKEMVNMIQ